MARGLLKDGFGKATPISRGLLTPQQEDHRGLLARFTDGVNETISSINPMGWMSPAQPMRRVAPPGTQARIWDYRFGQNIDYTPKAFEGTCYEILRSLAQNYDLLALVIETRKDQVSRVPHSFQVRKQDADEPPAKTKQRQLEDKRVGALNEFFKRPDGMHTFTDWQRMILDDMFVIDAPCTVPRWRRDGGLYGFDVIDGSTISLLIDEQGRSPLPPDPAYRQIIKGMPAVDMMSPCPELPGTDQCFFAPRNCRTQFLYGFSGVEQCIMCINIGLRKEISQLAWFTDGTIPDVFLEAPEGISEDRLQQMETMWNEKFATLTARRKANFIPFGTKVTFAKDPKLKDELDEFIARKIAYAFSVSPTALVKMVNRAAGQQMSEDAKAEGLEPILYWWKDYMDSLLEFMGCGDIEYQNGTYTRENPLQAAQIHQIYLSTIDDQGHSVMRANEIRQELGMDTVDYEAEQEEADKKAADLQKQLQAQNGQDDDDAVNDQKLRQEQEDKADTPRPKAAQCTFCTTGMKLLRKPYPHHVTEEGVEIICQEHGLAAKAKKKLFASKPGPICRDSSRRSLVQQAY